MHRFLIAAALVMSSPAGAQSGHAMREASQEAGRVTFSPTRLIEEFDISTLRSVVSELRGTVTANDDGSGYRIEFENGTVTSAYFTACSNGKCLGTHLQGSFGKPSDKTVAQTDGIVNAFNRDNRTLKVWSRGDGRSMADQYIIADGGITMENYRRQLSLYSYMLKQYRQALYTGG